MWIWILDFDFLTVGFDLDAGVCGLGIAGLLICVEFVTLVCFLLGFSWVLLCCWVVKVFVLLGGNSVVIFCWFFVFGLLFAF